jgi:transposase
MFVRKKKNASGITTILVVEKRNRKNVVLKIIGTSTDAIEINYLYKIGLKEIERLQQLTSLPFNKEKELEYANSFTNCINSFSLVGPELLLGKLFDEVGFNTIPNEFFRHLVLTRLVYPVSKLKTVDYLFKYKGIQLSVYTIYRYLDDLHKHYIEQVKAISLRHTLFVLNNTISIVFYDVTTLYFETKYEDDFKKMGFSKDGKHHQPQIVLGLLVSEHGYPLDYHVFEGDKYEGNTLIPVIEHFQTKHKPEQLIIVADAGLLSKANIEGIINKNYQYILGARIKNQNELITKQILALKLSDTESQELKIDGQTRLIISYKKSRAINDEKNRKRGLEKLKAKVKTGTLNKTHINNKGYNKYLKIDGEAKVSIDEQKYNDDNKWDGLKGYLTNTQLHKNIVIEKYHELWQIEKTFRIAKSDLEIRPIYHQLKRRIEAQICIAFAACKIYKELERQLKQSNSSLSPERAIDILKTIYSVEFETPYSTTKYKKLIIKTQEQKELINLFNLKI